MIEATFLTIALSLLGVITYVAIETRKWARATEQQRKKDREEDRKEFLGALNKICDKLDGEIANRNVMHEKDLKDRQAERAQDLKDRQAERAQDLKDRQAERAQDLKDRQAEREKDLKAHKDEREADIKARQAERAQDLKDRQAERAQDRKERADQMQVVDSRLANVEKSQAHLDGRFDEVRDMILSRMGLPSVAS